MNLQNVNLQELVWTIANLVGGVVHLWNLKKLVQKRRILKRSGENGAVSLIYLQKLILSMMFIGISAVFVLIGWGQMNVPSPVRPENQAGNSNIANVLIGAAIAMALYAFFDMYMTDRIEEEAARGHMTRDQARDTPRDEERDAGRDITRDVDRDALRDPKRDVDRDIEHDKVVEGEG